MIRVVLDLPEDLYAAVGRMAVDIRDRGRASMTPELLASALIRIGLGAAAVEAIDSPAVLDRLGAQVVDLFVRGVLR